MSYTCPVCGYPELTEDPNYDASFEICPSCTFHFRVTDDDKGYTYEQWRDKWVQGGMIWDEGDTAPPNNWNPIEQLKNIGVMHSKK